MVAHRGVLEERTLREQTTLERIYQASLEPKQFVILHGLRHDAAYRGPIEQWRSPVITFIDERGTAH
jgi:hypothetical protein